MIPLKSLSTEITDTKFNTKGVFSGIATHDNYRDWNLNLQINAPERLLVLDTPPDEDELYYGTSFISGNAVIQGPVDALDIKVFASHPSGNNI